MTTNSWARWAALTIVAGCAAAHGATPLEIRVVHGPTPLHLEIPAEAPRDRKARTRLELEAWSTLAPVVRVARAMPNGEALHRRFRDWAAADGRILSNASVQPSSKDGLDALAHARGNFRGGPRTAEQVAVWRRVAFTPDAEVMTVRYALLSFANDAGVEDTRFTLIWRSDAVAGADPVTRVGRWTAADAALFHQTLAAADATLLAAFARVRRGPWSATAGPRGTLPDIRDELTLVEGDDARVLALGDDDELHSAPRSQWRPRSTEGDPR